VSRVVDSPVLYFGKLPSRGDFVRSNHGPALIQVMDRWLSGGMELMAADARWKMLYDRATPVQFAFMGSRHAKGMAGHLMASQDASGRRFPFIAATMFDSDEPLAFLSRAPMALTRAWTRLERSALQAHQAADATPLLADMADSQVQIECDPRAYDASFADFCEVQTVGSFQAMLQAAGHGMNLRQLVLGLGLLLQPVVTSGESRLERGLMLPMPHEPLYRPTAAALWLELISGFVSRAAFELSVFMPRTADGTAPMLLLGFEGNSPRSLHALLDAEQQAELYVDMRQADWVEDAVAQDYAVQKLSSYLQQDDLSLRQAVVTFKEVFLGA
jgi:type VI secretion system protein ImpM